VDTLAYRLNAGSANKATFYSIGTVALGIKCTDAYFTNTAGESKYIIADRMLVTLNAGETSRPLQMYVECEIK